MNFIIQRTSFKIIFPKLVKSYAMDAILEKRKKKGSSQKPVEEAKVIHMAFFKMDKEERIGRMSGYKRRRGYRI
jgi:hypothetical protein